MNSSSWSSWSKLALGVVVGLATQGCQRILPPGTPEGDLPPAYVRNQITDPVLRKVAEDIRNWAVKQVSVGKQPLYSRVEVLPPAQTVQPYGVGAFQQEPRLPVILTIGPGWSGLQATEKETQAAQAFRDFSDRLQALKRQPPLRLTLTIQTPQGTELAWINHLDPNGKNLHGDD